MINRPIKILFLLIPCLLFAQEFSKDFINPINIPIELVGNFAELRKNHFHTGIDIRTNQVEGLPILSVQDGYISRINISSVGYGNALYVNHPNGYTSVYAHLQRFNKKIEEFIKQKQTELKKNEIEFYPKENEVLVKKSDTIALSGNSGGSQGPHLHFEIRDTKTENAMNPFLFGFDVKDSINPIFNQIYIYPINGKINDNKNKFLLNKLEEFTGYGNFGIGIKAFDRHDALNNLNGIYSIKVSVNDQVIFYFKADEILFDRPRLINVSTDYSANILKGDWIYKCFKGKGNDLKMIQKTINNGIIELESGITKKIKIEVADFAKNLTLKEFNVRGIENEVTEITKKKEITTNSFFLKYTKSNQIKTEAIDLKFPEGVFEEDVNFELTELEDGYELMNSTFPALNYYTISAKPKNIASKDLYKTVFVRYFKNRGAVKKEFLTGKIIENRIIGSFRDFGVFKFAVDNVAPTIKSRNLKVTNNLKFTLLDSVSGIDTYEAFIDNEWVICDFDKKYNLLTINLNESISVGKHKIILKATDKVGNLNETAFDFEKL